MQLGVAFKLTVTMQELENNFPTLELSFGPCLVTVSLKATPSCMHVAMSINNDITLRQVANSRVPSQTEDAEHCGFAWGTHVRTKGCS